MEYMKLTYLAWVALAELAEKEPMVIIPIIQQCIIRQEQVAKGPTDI